MSVNKHSAHYRFTRHRLPSKLLNFLALPNNGFVTSTSRIVKKKTSANGNHVKLVIELHDGLLIETNIQRYHEDGAVHASVSVCSQVGCDVGCSINCPTTSVSFEGNLFAGEITEQVAHAQKVFCRENRQVEPSHAVRKVSFMSGESLHNYQQVVEACHVLSNKRLWNLSHGRITVSTMGITPRIYDLTRDFPNVILCVGLHAPNQELRRTVVPVAEQYPLDELMAALDNHRNDPRDRINGSITSPTSGKKRRMVMVEYIMSKLTIRCCLPSLTQCNNVETNHLIPSFFLAVEGKTSSLECAHELGRLCENRHLVVNLIPFIIAGDPETSRQCPPPAHIKKFQSIVASYGAICNVRLNMTAQKSEMVTRQMNLHKRQSVISDVPEEIDGLSFWQKLSFVRLRGWDKEALKERQEKRGRSSPGVPREIIARTPSSAGAHESDNKSAGSDILGLADQGTSTAEAAPISAPTLPVEEDEKQSPSEVASEHEHHHTRRLWILPAAITAVVLCKMLLYERRR